MELVAVEKIRVVMPEGPRDLEPGDTLSLPDTVGKRLLELAPGRVRVMASGLPFPIGSTVTYTIPDPQCPSPWPQWVEHTGTVQMFDARWGMVLVVPLAEKEPWRWVPLISVRKGTS